MRYIFAAVCVPFIHRLPVPDASLVLTSMSARRMIEGLVGLDSGSQLRSTASVHGGVNQNHPTQIIVFDLDPLDLQKFALSKSL